MPTVILLDRSLSMARGLPTVLPTSPVPFDSILHRRSTPVRVRVATSAGAHLPCQNVVDDELELERVAAVSVAHGTSKERVERLRDNSEREALGVTAR